MIILRIKGLPHAGGDIPSPRCTSRGRLLAAPRRWGYTPLLSTPDPIRLGCPTQVGIYPLISGDGTVGLWLPHAGGDIPSGLNFYIWVMGAAPRRWGYTSNGQALVGDGEGCPTQVGIYLLVLCAHVLLTGLPHAGGDIPWGMI